MSTFLFMKIWLGIHMWVNEAKIPLVLALAPAENNSWICNFIFLIDICKYFRLYC